MALSMIVEMTSLTPAGDPQEAGDPGPQRAGDHRDDDRHDGVQLARQQACAGEGGGGEGGDAVLALDADVEQVHPEADGGGHAGEVEHDGAVEDVDDVAAARAR